MISQKLHDRFLSGIKQGNVMRHLFVAVLFFVHFGCLSAQNQLSWEQFLEQLTLDYNENINYQDTEDNNDIAEERNDLIEELQLIHDNPYNINTITEEQLNTLPFLDENQKKDILAYIEKNSPMKSLGELMLIRSLDLQTRLKLMLFCFAGENQNNDDKNLQLDKLWRYTKQEVVMRTDIPFYTKAGYRNISDSVLLKNPNKQYQGDKMYRSLRYILSNKHLDVGVQVEKDAGEKDFDYMSFFVYLKDVGKIQKVILGDYNLSFGQGLVVNTSGGFGKIMTLSSMHNMDKGISKHSSMSESSFFRGAATTLALSERFNVTAFTSFRYLDATLLNDSSDIITTFKTDGMHRTHSEIQKKQDVSNFVVGGNIRWESRKGKFRVGLTGLFSHLSKSLQPKCDTPASLYRYYNPRGSDFSNYSLNYLFTDRFLTFSGETAFDNKNSFATINKLQFKPNSYNTLTLIQRTYSAKYNSLFGKSFGENSSPQNESGVFVGWDSEIVANLKIETYADFFYFPYLKYQVSDKSYGYEGHCQMMFSPNQKSTWTLRYNIKSKQKNYTFELDDEEITQLAFYTNQNIRLQYDATITPHFSIKSTASLVFNHLPSNTSDKGYLISTTLKYTGDKKERATITLTHFNTDNYNARVYAYESGLLYSYGMMSYFYNGVRLSANISKPLCKILTLNGKIGWTRYFNRDVIGTGLEEINGQDKIDLQIQLRCVF